MSTSQDPTPAVPLRDLLEDLPDAVLAGDGDVLISAITHDSRAVQPGSIFVAYRGVYQDVHRYIPDALARGAAAVVIERPLAELARELRLPDGARYVQVPDSRRARADLAAALYGHPSREMAVVGVTGTDGKTTTSTLTQAMLLAAGRSAGLVSTVAAQIGTAVLDTGLHVTTPEPEELQALLAAMVRAGMDCAVLEVTSHGLVQQRVRGVDFDVAVITNVTHEALEYHGTLEAYRAAKATLFEGLAGSRRKRGVAKTAVLNADDEATFEALHAIPADRHLVYSVADPDSVLRPSNLPPGTQLDFTANDVRHSSRGLAFTAITPHGQVTIESPLIGRYNVGNLLAAMAASGALGAGPDAWRAGAAAVAGVPGRMEVIEAGQAYTAIVDFAHTPNALDNALATARELTAPGGRVLAVFGCAGLRDPAKRPLMGRVAAQRADVTIVTAEDPRTEDLAGILEATAAGLTSAGGREGASFHRVPDRGAAIRAACAEARAGDVVIVCGKGHEQSMCFGEVEYPWDDRAALRAALRGEAYGGLPTGEN